MAIRAAVSVPKPPTTDYEGMSIVQWAGLTQTTSDEGEPAELPNFADRTVQVTGALGVGGSVRIEGSLDGTNWAVLTDPQGNDLNLNALKIEAVSEMTRYIRPRITAGDGTTNLTVTLLARKN